MNTYLALDTETGGLGNDKSLLTVYMAVLDENFELTTLPSSNPFGLRAELDMKLKPEDGVYRVEAKALQVNGIDLAEHDKQATGFKTAGETVTQFLFGHAHYEAEGVGRPDRKMRKLIPIGHGVGFDVKFMRGNLVEEKHWEANVSHRVIDTSAIARFLMMCGKIPESSGGLSDVAASLGIDATRRTDGHWMSATGEDHGRDSKPGDVWVTEPGTGNWHGYHSAKFDAMMSVQVLKRMIAIVRDSIGRPVGSIEPLLNNMAANASEEGAREVRENIKKGLAEAEVQS